MNAGGEKQTLSIQSGETTLEFSANGTFIGDVTTQNGNLDIYAKNRTSSGTTPPMVSLTFDTTFRAQKGGINSLSLNNNTTITSKDTQNNLLFISEETGKNLITIWGDGTQITLQNSNNQTSQTLLNQGNMTLSFLGENQTFSGNIASKSGKIDFMIGGEDEKKPQTSIIGKVTINGNVLANGGSNIFNFINDGSTFSMGNKSNLIANGGSTNTFTINKNVTFTSDLNLSGDAGGNGGNIFNISESKNLTLQDSSGALKALNTSGGQSKVNFLGSGSILANINTTGGKANFSFVQNGTIGSSTQKTTIASSSGSNNIFKADSLTFYTSTIAPSSLSVNTFKAQSLEFHTTTLSSTNGGTHEIYAPTITFSETGTISSSAISKTSSGITIKASSTGAGNLNISADNTAFQVSGDGSADILIQTAGQLTLSAKSLSSSGNDRNNITIYGLQTQESLVTLGTSGINSSGGEIRITAKTLGNGGDIVASGSGKNILSFSGNVVSNNLSSSNTATNTLSIEGVATLGNISSTGGSNTLALKGGGSVGSISATGGENIFHLGKPTSLKTTTTLTTKGTYTATSGSNAFNFNSNSYILDMKDSSSSALALETNGGKTIFGFNANNGELKLASITNTRGSTQINFAGSNNTVSSSITTASSTTSITLSSSASGKIVGSITASSKGENHASFSQNSTLTLLGANNTLSSITLSNPSTTAKLILDSQNNAITTTINSSFSGLNVDFQGGNQNAQAIQLILNGVQNTIPTLAITGTKNTLTLSNPSTTTFNNKVSVSGGIVFDVKDEANLTFSKGLENNSGNGVVFDFFGTSTVAGTIKTTENAALYGTTINLNDNSNVTFSDSITQEESGSTIINFKSAKASKATLTLNGEENQISDFNILDGNEGILKGGTITTNTFALGDQGEAHFTLSNTSTSISSLDVAQQGNTLTLDASLNSVNLDITYKTPSNHLILAFKSTDQNHAFATLNGDDNKLYSLSITSGINNKLILTNGSTSIQTAVSVGTSQALTFDLSNAVNLTLADNLTNAGNTTFNFNNATLTSTITTNGTNAITDIKVLGNCTGTITGGITTTSGVTKVSFANGGTLKLQGSQNQLTNVSATTSGILSLDGVSNASGVSASVANAIVGDNITLNFNGENETKKAELTLTNGGNSIKSLTLSNGSGATIGNNLVLSKGSTSIKNQVNIKANQAFTFDLGNTVNLTLTNNLTNSGNTTFNLDSAILSGTITTNNASAITIFNLSQSALATITGNINTQNGASNIIFGGGSTLKLQGSNNQITSLSGTTGTLSLDGSNSASGVRASIDRSINGSSITLNFNGAQNKQVELTLSSGNNTLTSITLGNDSTNNKLILSQGNTNLATSLVIGNSQALAIDLGNTANFILSAPQASTAGTLSNSGTLELNFKNGSSTLTGSIATNSNATTTINLQGSPSSTATLIGSIATQGGGNFTLNAYAETSTFQYDNGDITTNLEFSAGTHIINLQTQNSTLYWKKHNGSNYTETDIFTTGGKTQINFNANATFVTCSQTSGGSTEINIANGKSGTIEGDIITSDGITTLNFSEGAEVTTLTLNGANKTLSTSGGRSTINFKGDQGIFNGIIKTSGSGALDINVENAKSGIIQQTLSTSDSGKNNLTFKGSNSALILKGSSNTLSQITSISGNDNIISLSEGETHDTRTENNQRRKLTIQNITQDSNPLTLVSQTTATQADTFVINGSTTKTKNSQQPSTHSLGIVVANGVKLSDIGKSGEILVASVKNASGTTPSIVFGTTSQVVSGFTTATATFDTKLTDESGRSTSTDYTSYFIKSMQNAQVIAAEQEITATAFTLNYDLYMANFNSLNKRMGELRENTHSQGVWARVFNGALSNDFGLSTKSNYTTIQAGYDYAFGSEGANNYLGFALSYALSTSTSKHAFDDKGQKRSIDSIYSNAFELALYNSYVSDEGWYNDTIAKFSYLMSDFKINNITNLNNVTSTTNDAKNFALTLSDEVGYKFTLGESKEWGITPQLELGFGYFSQSDFKQTLENLGAFLQSNSDFLLTLRTRVGSSFSYDFKSFTQAKDFNASLYLGAFYEYDYVNGGEITFRTDQITQDTQNNLSNLQSDGRVVLNAGVNMSVKDNTRIYFDFEKSFLGKINTDYQVNFGVRYSFGESDGYTPLPTPLPQEEKKAPLKIDELQATQMQKEESQKSKE